MVTFRKVSFSIMAASAFLAPFLVFAAEAKGSDLKKIVENIVSVSSLLITLMMVLSIVVLGYGIVKLIMAAGSPEVVKKAKGIIVWGIIGVAVFVSLFGLIKFIQTYFGFDAGSAITAPKVEGLPVVVPK